MKELYYFSKSDVMIQVQYNSQSQSLRYSSHRELTDDERATIERYLLKNVVTETLGAATGPTLDYIGIEYKLIHSLNQFHSVKSFRDQDPNATQGGNPFKSFMNKNIEQSVQDLINSSMTNYYFEKIGNTILEARKEIQEGADSQRLREYRSMLDELVAAYNQCSGKKVEVKDVMPAELCL